MIKQNTHHKILDFLPYLVISLFWLALHYTLITTDVLLMRDDLMLVNAVNSVESISDYFNKLLSGQLYDLQPVRDFSFLLNIKLHSLIGFGGFHLTNLLLGLAILTKSKDILLKYVSNKWIVIGALMLLACHPLFNSVMAWTSNRKHLLSILFIISFIDDWLNKEKITWKGFLLIVLSLLSQPITAFVPLIIVINDFYKNKKITLVQIGVISVSVLALVANYWFYKNASVFTGRNAMEIFTANIAGEWILNLGRVLPQLIIPISYAIEYNPGNILSLVGLFLAVFFLFFIFKYEKNNKTFLLFFVLAASTLFPVLKWGPRDPYLLASLLFLISSLSISISKLEKCKKIVVPYFLILLFLSYQSWKVTEAWASDLSLNKFSYESEGGLENQMKYAIALNLAHPEKSYIVFADIKDKYPDVFQFNFLPLLAESYFFSNHLTTDDKMNEYLSYNGEDKYYLFFRGKFMESNHHKDESRDSFTKLRQILNSEPNQKSEFRAFICQKYKEDCERLFL